MPTIYIETHGCQMNEADSEELAERASSAGYTIATRPEDASVLVLNTCTVRDNAETRAYGRINHWKKLKSIDPSVKVVVTGCLAEQDRDRMQSVAPHVDGVYGTKELARLGDALVAWRAEIGDDDLTTDVADERALLMPMGGHPDGITKPYDVLRAYVNVQRGCSYYCTYCIVPHVRGRFDHRPIGEILTDVRARVALGAREITLVGQTVNAWRDANGADFADLLESVADIDGLERVAFVTSHPKDLTEKLARAFGTISKLNPRLHLPVQSAANRVLRKMNRKYTIEQYRETIAMVRSYVPDWALTTDLIVAFPTETDDEFEATVALCAEGLFAQAYMFIYSTRRGTPAALWEQIPAEVGGARLRRLAAVEDAAVRAYHDRKIGTVVRALVHGPSRRDPRKLAGKTLDNVTVIFPSEESPDAPDVARPWVDVLVEAAHVWGVRGTALRRAERFDAPGERVVPPAIDLIAM